MNDPKYINPFAPPTAETSGAHWFSNGGILLKVAVLLQSATIVIGGVASLVEIESIVVSGGILLLLGLVTFGISLFKVNWPGMMMGISGVVLSTSVFCVIFFLRLSPGKASTFVPHLILVYGLVFLPMAWYVIVYGVRKK